MGAAVHLRCVCAGRSGRCPERGQGQRKDDPGRGHRGGTDHFENLQLLCGACNSLKGRPADGVPDGAAGRGGGVRPLDTQKLVRKEIIEILQTLADGTWTSDRLTEAVKSDEPLQPYSMAFSLLVAARHVVNVQLTSFSNYRGPGPPEVFEVPANMGGWIVSLSGLDYLKELTHPIKVLLERHWFPMVVATAAILSSIVSTVTLILKA